MHVLIAGGSGLIGQSISKLLESRGHRISILSRNPSKHDNAVGWDIESGEIELEKLKEIDLCINLAGENISEKRWSDKQKDKIQSSRINSVRTLHNAFAKLKNPPKSFISASAIGYYGDRSDELLTEESSSGNNFLSETVDKWETEIFKMSSLGISTTALRFGVILSSSGGALRQMLPIFKLGLGGRLGSGDQFFSWISLDDASRAVEFVINEKLSGAINVVSPQPITNSDFTKALGETLKRPTCFPVPKFALRLALDQMADELLLSSTRVQPKRLLESCFSFNHTRIEDALRDIIQ